MLRRMSLGGARARDLDVLLDVATNISGRKTLCALGDFAVEAIGSAFIHFRADLEDSVAKRTAANGHGPAHVERQTAHV
jgi:NADH:ubiquinone oxidoreductase subunit F (NADH-binding)